jgi:hypothetical protein
MLDLHRRLAGADQRQAAVGEIAADRQREEPGVISPAQARR